MTDKKHGGGNNVDAQQGKHSGDASAPKRARSRRLVLKSLVTGGAATTIKTLPDKWTHPVAESVLLPAHAQVSQGVLSCRVQS